MKALFVTARLYMPDANGGAARSMHGLLCGARARGIQCEATAAMPPGARLNAYRLLHRLSARRIGGLPDRLNGYTTYRTAEWQVPQLVERRARAGRPDVIVTDQLELLPRIPSDLPCVVRVTDVEFSRRSEPLPERPVLRLFSNSRFTADRVRERFGVESPVLYPLIHFERYRVERPAPEYITFINPIPKKGLEIALAVARLLPHRRFLFVEGWALEGHALRDLGDRIAALHNVTFERWTPDVGAVYARTRLLLVPSQWEEAFGRVVVEAQASGVPAVTSDRGGLPEAVGEGGRVVAHDATPEAWAAAIESLLHDQATYREFCERALANTRRREFDADYVIDGFTDLLVQAAGASRAAP